MSVTTLSCPGSDSGESSSLSGSLVSIENWNQRRHLLKVVAIVLKGRNQASKIHVRTVMDHNFLVRASNVSPKHIILVALNVGGDLCFPVVHLRAKSAPAAPLEQVVRTPFGIPPQMDKGWVSAPWQSVRPRCR